MASGYPSIVYVGPEKEPEADVFLKQLLLVMSPIWAEVGWGMITQIMSVIWSQSRLEVCVSLDSFRNFQGGVYHLHDIVKGYLLEGIPPGKFHSRSQI